MRGALLAAIPLWPLLAAASPEHGGGLGPAATILFAAINFAIFAAVLVRFGGRPVVLFFRERERAIREEFERYREEYETAERDIAALRERLAAIPAEKERLREHYERQAALLYDEILNGARLQAEFIRRETDRSLRDQLDRCRGAATDQFIDALTAELEARAAALGPEQRKALVDQFDRLSNGALR